jgi:hypothetical protein
VAGLIGVGTEVAEAGDGAPDDVGVVRRHGLVAEPEPVELAGAVGFDDGVGPPDEGLEHGGGAVVSQVERDGALAAVEGDVGGVEAGAVHAAEAVAGAGCFDLDDRRAEVGEEEGAVRAGGEPREVEDPDVGEGRVGGHRAKE